MRSWLISLVALFLGGLIGTSISGTILHGQPAAAVPVPRELTSYRDIVKKVLPAVVSIEAKAKPAKAKPQPARPGLANPLQRTPERDEDSLGFGSGFIVDPKGVVLTNYHVVEDAESLEVTLTDGRKFTSRDFISDTKTDLAIIRLQPKEQLPALQLGDSNQMEIGDRVLAIGAPFGLTGSVTAGIISAKKRSLHVNTVEDFLQTDAAINPGNSGGPLVNLEGQVIGISAAIKSDTGGFQGVGLAIASNLVADISKQLLKDGTVHRGHLGVKVKDITTDEMARSLGLKRTQGVQITRVYEDGPAARAEIVKGDVIVTLAGKTVKNTDELQSIVAGLPLGKSVSVTIVRDGKSRNVDLVIEEPRPETNNTGK